MRSYWIRVDPNTVTGILIRVKCGHRRTYIQKKTPFEYRGRDWHDEENRGLPGLQQTESLGMCRERGAWSQMAKKSRNPQTGRKPHILGCKASIEKKKEGKGHESSESECNLVLITPSLQQNCNKISYARRGTHHAPMPWHRWSKLNKDKNPSSLWEGGVGIKIKI